MSWSPVLANEPQLDLPRVEVLLHTKNSVVSFDVQLADTPETRAKGLMFRTNMPRREGMLFDFFEARPVSFWMENTPSALDLIFISDDQIVQRIARDAVPYSRATIPSKAPVRWVLEVNAGVADEIGLAVGDQVTID